jgi:hypothetical protein
MPELFTMPGTCALAPNIAIAWLDAPVAIRNMAHGDHQTPGSGTAGSACGVAVASPFKLRV